jgi:hypothetical protein
MYGRFAAGPDSVRCDANEPADCAHEKDLQTQAFSRAAEGIRTLDILHGKQDPRVRLCVECSCKAAGFRARRGSLQTPAFIGNPRGFPDPNRTEPGTSEPPEPEIAGAEQDGEDACFRRSAGVSACAVARRPEQW